MSLDPGIIILIGVDSLRGSLCVNKKAIANSATCFAGQLRYSCATTTASGFDRRFAIFL